MKQLISIMTLSLLAFAGYANDGKINASAATTAAASAQSINAGAVRFQFINHAAQNHTDSVLVIFDRFDHTGAGVIYKVYGTDQLNGIDVSAIPAGKYYVTVQCLGLHRDRLEKTITVKKQKNQMINIALADAERFSRDNVVIPVSHANLSDLAILNNK
jgi:hypothetical protein